MWDIIRIIFIIMVITFIIFLLVFFICANILNKKIENEMPKQSIKKKGDKL